MRFCALVELVELFCCTALLYFKISLLGDNPNADEVDIFSSCFRDFKFENISTDFWLGYE